MTIPARAHFVWIGPRLPWAYAFAVLSAARHGQLDEVLLHHTDELDDTPVTRALTEAEGVKLVRLEPHAWLEQLTQAGLDGKALSDLYREVESPVARSNMLRAAALLLHGGIYLDLDTITVRSLRPLLTARQFLAHEHIVWPHFVRSSRDPLLWLRSFLLSWLRSGLRRLPHGHRWFEHISSHYYLGINGAILGSEAGSQFLADYLEAMTKVPASQRGVKHALGTHLLQRRVEAYQGEDLTVHPPAVFYPLPPEISEHWFRMDGARLDDVLAAETRVVHWYASVRSKPFVQKIAPDYVKRHAQKQLYSALASRFALPVSQA